MATDNFDAYVNADFLGQTGTASDGVWAIVNDFLNVYKPASDGGVYGGSQACVRYVGATFAADHRSELTCRVLTPGSFSFIGVAVRCQSGSDTRYWLQTDGTNWFFFKRISGSGTLINSGTLSLTSGAKIALEVTGAGSATRLTAQYDTGSGWTNWTGIVSADPGSTYIDGGAPGVQGDGGFGTSILGDDWVGSDLGGGVVFPTGMSTGFMD